MGTASLRPNDLAVPSGAPLRDEGNTDTEPEMQGTSWVPSRSSNRASSPMKPDSINEKIRENYAEAARLRAKANEQEVVARAALDRASEIRERGSLFQVDTDSAAQTQFGAGRFGALPHKEVHGSATQKLGQALDSYVTFKRENMENDVSALQGSSSKQERKRALQFAMAELTRMNESVALKRSGSKTSGSLF